jgi:hypothetical protein
LGLCAPIAYANGVGKLYIASTFNATYNEPYGSAPEIDNNVAWTGTKCIHDNYEFTRQDKIQMIAQYVKSGRARSKLYIQSCLKSEKMDNCSNCEKCARTIIGLELAGLNPINYGFNISNDTFLKIKKNLTNGAWFFGNDDVFMWTDLQRHAFCTRTLPNPEAKIVIDWLKKVDLKNLKIKVTKKRVLSRIVTPFFKFLPSPLWEANRKLFDTLLLIFPDLLN